MSEQQVQRAKTCREQYGFWIGPGPGDQPFVFSPAGRDPSDGAPLTFARAATPYEAGLWEEGKLDRLASLVAPTLPRQSIPSYPAAPRPKSRWGKLLDSLGLGRFSRN